MSASSPELTTIKEVLRFSFDPLTNCLMIQDMYPAALEQSQDALKTIPVRFAVRSDKDSHFTTAIGIEDKEDENLTGLSSNKMIIRRIKIQSDENLDLDVTIWKKDTFDDTDLDLDAYCEFVSFLREDARRQTVSGGVPNNQYYYDSGELEMPYEDLDGTFELHISVNNRDNVAKTAGATGELIVEVEYEPTA